MSEEKPEEIEAAGSPPPQEYSEVPANNAPQGQPESLVSPSPQEYSEMPASSAPQGQSESPVSRPSPQEPSRAPVSGAPDDRPSPPPRGSRFSRDRGFAKKKVCKICEKKVRVSYRDPGALSRFTTISGKILPRRVSGACAKHQHLLAVEIKRARFLALLPYAVD